MKKWIATLGGVGHMPYAPGSFGSLLAVGLFMVIHFLGGIGAVVLSSFIFLAVGLWAVKDCLNDEDQDPSYIVIDELVGQFIALWPISLGLALKNEALFSHLPEIIIGFLAFRFFDILKFGPVKKAEKLQGAMGVMMDDVIAGVFAAVIVVIFGYFMI